MDQAVHFWIGFFLAAALIPGIVYRLTGLVLGKRLESKFGDRARIVTGSLSLLGTTLMLLGGLMYAGAEVPNLPGLMALIGVAVALATVEEFYRLPTQFAIVFRILIGIVAYVMGFSFGLGEVFPSLPTGIAHGVDFIFTLAFYVGLLYTVSLIDSIRCLASGVLLIVALTLFSLVLRWTGGGDPVLLTLLVAGMCLGHLFLLGSDKRLHLGAIGQVLTAVLLAAATTTSRTWGLTLGMLAVPVIACAAPLFERVTGAYLSMRLQDVEHRPAHLHSLLLSIGFSPRWVVLLIWLITLQVAVMFHMVYASKSLALAAAGFISLAMLLLFPLACLIRLSEAESNNRNPGRMRILFLSHYFYPEVNAPASRLYEHAKRWARAGHSVTVVCPVPSAPHGWPYEGYRNGLWQEESLHGIRVIRIWTFVAANKGRIRRTLNYLSYMASSLLALVFLRRHDVIVSTSPQFFNGLAGAIATLFRKEKFVLEIRDIWPESIAAVGAGNKKFLLDMVERLAAWMYSRADHIITVGEGYRDKLLEIGAAPAQNIDIVYNGIDFERFYVDTNAGGKLFDQWGLKGKFVVSYVGTIGMAHGLDVILEAGEKLKDNPRVAFLIVGDGAERKRLQTEAERRGLTNVRFAGLLPKEDIPGILVQSGATLVHLRKTELFTTVLPSKLFEGMAIGKPVILGVRGFAEDVLRRSGGGVVIEPEDAEALARVSVELSSEPARCMALGQQGATFVRREFNRDQLALRFVEILRNVALRDTPQPISATARERTSSDSRERVAALFNEIGDLGGVRIAAKTAGDK